jgi:Cu-processing system ATP-binding protein
MIRISDLHKKFGSNQVLSGLNLTIDNGGIVAILGPNGSGKTTLIKSILGMVVPNKGSIEINQKSIKNDWNYRLDINYLPQIANFPGNLKVMELIKMIKDLRNKACDETELIKTFGLEPFLDKKLSNLSGGTKQKVNILICFMSDSPLIILDEPTTGLDPSALIKLKELILREKTAGKTILITTHIMQFVEEISDSVVYLLEGKIYFQGSIAQLLQKTQQDNVEHAVAALIPEINHA